MNIQSLQKKSKKQKGFTLIEIMVAVTIVAIFASIAVPSFSQLIRNNRIPVTTNEFMSGLVLARSEALKRSRTVTLCASNNQSTCSGGTDFATGWIIYADCDESGSLTAGAADCDNDGISGESEIIKVHDGFENILIDGGAFSDISFEFSGRIAGPPKTIIVGHDASEPVKDVVINRVGRIRSEDH